jgi:hypothetical protein
MGYRLFLYTPKNGVVHGLEPRDRRFFGAFMFDIPMSYAPTLALYAFIIGIGRWMLFVVSYSGDKTQCKKASSYSDALSSVPGQWRPRGWESPQKTSQRRCIPPNDDYIQTCFSLVDTAGK